MFSRKGLPLLDARNGGSRPALRRDAQQGLQRDQERRHGHHRPQRCETTWADLKEYADFNQEFLSWAQAALKSGKTPEAAAAEWTIPERFKGYAPAPPTGFGGAAGGLQRLAEEMKQ